MNESCNGVVEMVVVGVGVVWITRYYLFVILVEFGVFDFDGVFLILVGFGDFGVWVFLFYFFKDEVGFFSGEGGVVVLFFWWRKVCLGIKLDI